MRSSADLLFESMAPGYGDRAIAVVLAGSSKRAARQHLRERYLEKVGGSYVLDAGLRRGWG